MWVLGALLVVVLVVVALVWWRKSAAEDGLRSETEDSASSSVAGHEQLRLQALILQGQGQLDAAFELLVRVPVDDALLEVLYNLALDFERQTKPAQAQQVFQYIAQHQANFRDVSARLGGAGHNSAHDKTVILAAGTNAETQVSHAETASLPVQRLGNYQIVRELGKGAMGAVYLGRDDENGRLVAIKTMALTQDFEQDELEDLKSRFFREAETAGRLQHPCIVSIFDAGEEAGLAYIAMEFLKGRDLTAYTKSSSLLPMATVVAMIADVAEALAYAHQQRIVHRDIKPANIMYDPDSGVFKIMDFGIARLTDASKTRTGMVLGTPSYMSPEQLAGKKIEGASDLFSLGVTLYQLLCGSLPFTAASMAQLMFRIANEPHPDIRTLRAEVPQSLVEVINRALAKDVAHRYVDGVEMAQALRSVMPMLRG